MAPGLAKKVFEESGGNMNLTKGSLVGANMLTNEAIGKAVESLDLGTLDLLGGGSNTPTGGGNVKSNVNGKSVVKHHRSPDLNLGQGLARCGGELITKQEFSSVTGGNDGGDKMRHQTSKSNAETLDKHIANKQQIQHH